MKLVILESPYAGRGSWWGARLWDRIQNVRYARACLRHSLKAGEAPIASHLLYTQPGVLDDDVPDERKLGIDAGLAWRAVAEGSIVYIDRGMTKGMRYGIDAALASGRRVVYRSIRMNRLITGALQAIPSPAPLDRKPL
jgi:hypothetical protein